MGNLDDRISSWGGLPRMKSQGDKLSRKFVPVSLLLWALRGTLEERGGRGGGGGVISQIVTDIGSASWKKYNVDWSWGGWIKWDFMV